MSQQWQYKIEFVANLHQHHLDAEGREGWELVSVNRGDTEVELVFKRAVQWIDVGGGEKKPVAPLFPRH